MKIKINHNNDELYCIYCKEKIELMETYIEVKEMYLDEEIIKTFHYDCFRCVSEEYEEEEIDE